VVLGALSLLCLAGALALRRWSLLLAVAAPVLCTLPRLPTDFYREPLGLGLAASRYDVLLEVLLMLIVAAGAGFAAEVPARSYRPLAGATAASRLHAKRLGALGVATVLALGVVRPLVSRLLVRGPRTSYQADYRFLELGQRELPPDAVVAFHWLEHFPSRGRSPDPDLGLALPYAPLSFARPDVTWVALGPTDPLPTTAERPLFYFRASTCSMAPSDVAARGTAEDGALVARLETECDRAAARVSHWLAQREEPATTIFWRLRDGRVRLGLGAVDPTP
jgi:hypothetical protein